MLRHMVFFRAAMVSAAPHFDHTTSAEEEAFTRAMLKAAPVPPRPTGIPLTAPGPTNGARGGVETVRKTGQSGVH